MRLLACLRLFERQREREKSFVEEKTMHMSISVKVDSLQIDLLRGKVLDDKLHL